MKQAGFILVIILFFFTGKILSQDNLSSYWSFDEFAIDENEDGSGNTPKVLNFGAEYIPAVVGNGLSYNGKGAYSLIHTEEHHNMSIIGEYGSISISLWFKLDQIPTDGVAPIFYCSLDGHPVQDLIADKGIYIEVGHGKKREKQGKLFFTVWNGNYLRPDICYNTEDPLHEGVWYHFVAVIGSGMNTLTSLVRLRPSSTNGPRASMSSAYHGM